MRRAPVLAVLLLAACAAPGVSDRPTSSAEPSASTPASTAPSPVSDVLHRDGFARVVATAVNVRTAPSINAPLAGIGQADGPPLPALVGVPTEDTHVYVLDGPTEADGYTWYQVAPTEGTNAFEPQFTGWMADGDGTDTWLVVEHPCPTGTVELADLTFAATNWAVRLGCFQDQELTLRGWFPALPPGEPGPGPCASEPAFLICVINDIRPIEMSYADPRSANRLQFAVDPALALVLPPRDQWIEVTGRFDHPAAAQCAAEMDLAGLSCRIVFVVSSVRALAASG